MQTIVIALLVATLLVVLGVLIYFATKKSAVAGSVGGVTVAEHPQAVDPVVASIPVVVALPPPVAVPLVRTILITKDTSSKQVTVLPMSRTFQIGEVKVYDMSGRLLTASDFSDAVYNGAVNTGVALEYPAKNAIDGNVNTFTHTNGETYATPLHQMKLTLATPTNVSRVEVYNRVDCCNERLEGAVISLIADNGVVLKSMTLTAGMIQTLTM